MSFVGDLLGIGGGGNKGFGFKAGSADLIRPVDAGQLNQAYQNTQSGLAQQQAFINALQAQNGIQNQSSVFNQQQALANQLQGVANGTGPNPAQAALNQATQQNISQQAALMAGQRGAGQNVGLIARQAAQQGGNLQQQAAGQAATLQAQQQIAGMNALAAQQQALGQTAGAQVGQQANATANYNQFAQGQQSNLLNAAGQYNSAQVGNMASQNTANAGIAQSLGAAQSALVGNIFNAAGGGATKQATPAKQGAAHGGMIEGYAQGGQVAPQPHYLEAYFSSDSPTPTMAKGGKVPVMLSPGEKYLTPEQAKEAAEGKVDPVKAGKKVPGKAKVKGDSLKNDVVPANLSPGGVVIPKSVLESKNPHKEAYKFVNAVMAKHKMASKK